MRQKQAQDKHQEQLQEIVVFFYERQCLEMTLPDSTKETNLTTIQLSFHFPFLRVVFMCWFLDILCGFDEPLSVDWPAVVRFGFDGPVKP
jgi:hypothetical protein